MRVRDFPSISKGLVVLFGAAVAPFVARLTAQGWQVQSATGYRAPNANAYAERFVRSIKEECLNRIIPFGERHHRRAVAEFVAHYHRERNHQGLDNELIEGQPAKGRAGRVRRHQRLGGLLNYYARAA
jgi:transposase InsO family protein